MKNLVFWNFLILALIIVCLFGCDPARNVADDIIAGDPSVLDPLNPSITGEDTPTETEKVPSVPDEKPPEPTGQRPQQEDSLGDIEELLEVIGELSEEIRSIEGPPTPPEPPLVTPPPPESTPDPDPPKITDSSIKDGAKNVGRNNVIWITFNERVVEGDLRLRIKGGRTIETRVEYGNETIHLERLGKNIVMEPLTTYVIDGTVSDAAGNETDVDITFTTGEGNF